MKDKHTSKINQRVRNIGAGGLSTSDPILVDAVLAISRTLADIADSQENSIPGMEYRIGELERRIAALERSIKFGKFR